MLAAIALPAFLGQRQKGQDSSAKSAARNLVTSIESFYATNKTYVGAKADQDVQKSGVLGTGDGEADITDATANGYQIVGKSASGNLLHDREVRVDRDPLVHGQGRRRLSQQRFLVARCYRNCQRCR